MPVSLSLVIPAFNEEATIALFVEQCAVALKKNLQDFEILTLDDCSTDSTLSILLSLESKYRPIIKVIAHRQNEGIAKTFEDLYKTASKEFVLLLPGDAEYLPSAIDRIVPLLTDCDIVLGERDHLHGTLRRRFISWIYGACTRLFFGVPIRNPGAIKCIRTKLIHSIPVISSGVFVDAERVIRASRKRFKIVSVPVEMQTRISGKARGAKWSLVFHAFLDIIKLRFALWYESIFGIDYH